MKIGGKLLEHKTVVSAKMCAHLAARFAIPAYKKAPALQQRAFAHNTGNYSYGNTA